MQELKKTWKPSPTAILNPRLDINFKAIFTQDTEGSKIALKSFLSATLGRKVTEVQLDPNEPPAETQSDMQMSFDVNVTFEDGEKASIEMQGREQDYDYAARSEVEAARLLNNAAKKGCEWNVEKVYQISVLNFHYKRGDKSEMSWYIMKDANGCELSSRLNVIYIDLLTIKALVGTPVEKLTPLQKWGMYFSYADDEKKADYIGQIANSERGIMEATTIIKRMSEEDAAFFREFSRDKAMRDYNAGMSAAAKKGLEQGMQQGLKQGMKQGLKQGMQQGLQQGLRQKAVEAATNLLKMNILSPEQIAQAAGLTLEEVLELQKEIGAGATA
ncbi:MAG: Rpn family recombination-promoting nuclease/putative transposase [Treponema sp.]|nr:Rpn family recombination-promoting nuclease/putative transposase [Treponema sp.]